MAGPRAGLRVPYLSRILAGPWCTQILADMGAEVIKVERPGVGDDTRHWGFPVTGFGQTGPMVSYPGYHYPIQAQAGLMSITGKADSEPGAGQQMVGVAVGDLTTGMNAAIAILAALHHRNQCGQGQYIDMSLLDVQVGWLANQGLNYLCSGAAPKRTRDHHPNVVPYQPFPAKDGKSLLLSVMKDNSEGYAWRWGSRSG